MSDDDNDMPLPVWAKWARWAIAHNLANILYAFSVLIIVVVVALFSMSKWLNFTIIGDQIYLNSVSSVNASATVDAFAGFQSSGIKVRSGEVIKLAPNGRVTVDLSQPLREQTAIKGWLVKGTPELPWDETTKGRYPSPNLTDTNVFFRGWVGPEGQMFASDLFEGCQLRPDLGWGALIAVVLKHEPTSREDPFEALQDSGLTTNDLIPVPGETTISVTQNGWLSFIINDGVISPYSPTDKCKKFYSVLYNVSGQLINDMRHQLPLESIPLILYADNAGEFRITVRNGN